MHTLLGKLGRVYREKKTRFRERRYLRTLRAIFPWIDPEDKYEFVKNSREHRAASVYIFAKLLQTSKILHFLILFVIISFIIYYYITYTLYTKKIEIFFIRRKSLKSWISKLLRDLHECSLLYFVIIFFVYTILRFLSS